jgi:HPt (histidine-containing phosphotransfer) domain-containing protein
MLIDEDLLGEVLAALDHSTVIVVHGLFMGQSPVLAAQAADADTPLPERAEAAHTLKGLALQFGLSHLCETLAALERACRDDDALLSGRLSSELGDLLKRSSEALDRHLQSRGIPV